jgi:hypothetical protein
MHEIERLKKKKKSFGKLKLHQLFKRNNDHDITEILLKVALNTKTLTLFNLFIASSLNLKKNTDAYTLYVKTTDIKQVLISFR